MLAFHPIGYWRCDAFGNLSDSRPSACQLYSIFHAICPQSWTLLAGVPSFQGIEKSKAKAGIANNTMTNRTGRFGVSHFSRLFEKKRPNETNLQSVTVVVWLAFGLPCPPVASSTGHFTVLATLPKWHHHQRFLTRDEIMKKTNGNRAIARVSLNLPSN